MLNLSKTIRETFAEAGVVMDEKWLKVVEISVFFEMCKASMEALVALKGQEKIFWADLETLIGKYRDMLNENERKAFDETVEERGLNMIKSLAKLPKQG